MVLAGSAGVIAMGVVGSDIRTVPTYQLFGVRLAQLHEEFDVDGDGSLTRTEISHGLIGQPSELVAGVGHVMNLTSKFTGKFGEPDPAVLKDLGRWLKAHR